MRRFRLDRHEDVTGVSGTGCVALGCEFNDGTTVIRWLGKTRTTTIHDSLESVRAVHCHQGRTTIRWEDKCCFQCGAEAINNHGPGFCPYCGASWDEPVDEKNPALGKWVPALTIGAEPTTVAERPTDLEKP
jgi:hypothetical protein